MNSNFDYIIVGKGLAGMILAHHLVMLGKKVLVYDEFDKNSSSRVAAGLYNPITGRKMVKTWKADVLFPFLKSYYGSIQSQSSAKFLFDEPIYRPFISNEEQNEWSARSADESYQPYIVKLHYKSINNQYKDDFGGVELGQCGYLNVTSFLDTLTGLLSKSNIIFKLINEKFNYNELELTDKSVEYKGNSAKQIIFCQGVKNDSNTYFNWLPFSPVKGEILTVEAALDSKRIINRGVFVIPIEKNRFRVGSTYDNYDLTSTPTEKGLKLLEQKLNELIDVNFKVVKHTAGVRPATKDRKPIIGMHPIYKNVGIFNGLGTKGVSLAPYFANQFALHLVNKLALDKEVAIERYYTFFKKDE